ncbi:MAG: TIGR00159 family protein, partial [Oscillospiraceae bacterium]|nr:TIGR00159 family protein [Oscillospiraceae bacterium]
MENFLYDMKGIFNSFGLSDLVDIVIVAYIIYQAVCLLRETRALQLIKGLAMLGAVYLIASLFRMRSLTFLMTYIFQYGALAVFIMFQPELRRSLEQVGRA